MVTKGTAAAKAPAKPIKRRPDPELPAPEIGTGGRGGGVVPKRPGGIGGPNEMPSPIDLNVRALVNEVITLRQRLNAVETQLLSSAVGRVGSFFHPAELPEGGEGGGGGGGGRGGGGGGGGGGGRGPFPGEFNPAEIPVDFRATLTKEMTALTSRLNALETRLTKSLQDLTKSVNQLRR